MNIVIDTCTLINIEKSGCLEYIQTIPSINVLVGDIVYEELSARNNTILTTLGGRIERIDINEISIEEFTHLISVENLGEGEAECIAIGRELGVLIGTDDGKARKYVSNNIGCENLIGSIGVIRQCVRHQIKTAAQAYRGYKKMVSAGAFLPKFSERDFLTLIHQEATQAEARL